MKKLILLAACSVGMSMCANASIILNLTAITPSGGNFVWSYNVVLSDDQTWRNLGTLGSTGLSDFTEIIDFAGFTGVAGESFVNSASCAACTWTFVNPPASGPGAPFAGKSDSGSILNPVLELSSATMSGLNLNSIGTWNITSTIGGNIANTANSSFSSQALATATGLTTLNQGNILAPSAVPEPMTLSLMGVGLLGLGLLRKRIR